MCSTPYFDIEWMLSFSWTTLLLMKWERKKILIRSHQSSSSQSLSWDICIMPCRIWLSQAGSFWTRDISKYGASHLSSCITLHLLHFFCLKFFKCHIVTAATSDFVPLMRMRFKHFYYSSIWGYHSWSKVGLSFIQRVEFQTFKCLCGTEMSHSNNISAKRTTNNKCNMQLMLTRVYFSRNTFPNGDSA